ncbi:MAG TPA: amidase family protein [Silvibacterium sp.]|nr:amidase family protein [Silvibacterium sp.]
MEIQPSPIEAIKQAAAADPERITHAALSRMNGNASRNTYLSSDETRTRDQAARLAQQPSDVHGPLHGLPIALKDCFDLEGFVTTSGSRFYARHNTCASEDSWVAAQLKAAGAIIIGKTHMQMLAYGITGENRDYGDCLQPEDATRLTGGSSSGSAAAVQEGSAVAAIGTDTGGSIRAPAALCGLAGYRASIGIGDWHGTAHLAPSFDTIGWLCRDLRDLPQLAQSLFGFPTDMGSGDALRVSILSGSLLEDCDAPVLDSMATWKERILRAGAQATNLQPDFFADAFSIYAPLQAAEAAGLHAGFFDQFEPAIADRLHWGASMKPEEIAEWRANHQTFVRETDALFTQADFLLMPAVPLARLIAGNDQTAARPRILRYTTPGSLAGLPAVVLPGRPGLQLLAARGDDRCLLHFAAYLGTRLATEEAS